MKHWWLWLTLAALVPAVPSAPHEDLRAALTKAQASWRAHKPSSYEFTIQVTCFCVGIAKVPPSFRVVDGQSVPVGDLDAASRRFYQSFNTIEKLFAAIEWSLSRGQYKSTVQYDDKLGFPVAADLDPQRMVADDELYIRVTNFRAFEK